MMIIDRIEFNITFNVIIPENRPVLKHYTSYYWWSTIGDHPPLPLNTRIRVAAVANKATVIFRDDR